MLEVTGLETFYGASQALFGVSLTVGEGEVVALLGRNGMGKTTTVASIMGLVPPRAGGVRFLGRELAGLPSHAVARAGLGLVPEGRQAFPNLTVRENLVATAANRFAAAAPWTLERVYALFPSLAERSGNLGLHLSGGEQQMLAIGRALMTNPLLLILDEATEGLAPRIREAIWAALRLLAGSGQSILVIDKNVDVLMDLAARALILEKGRVAWAGRSAELQGQEALRHRLLGV
ncbi:MAG: ABC transporter ATP-binding protein [Magnetospirillum sp.]|nr:ABC transporter ATP-binding protein [Magnetospirillum sp.]